MANTSDDDGLGRWQPGEDRKAAIDADGSGGGTSEASEFDRKVARRRGAVLTIRAPSEQCGLEFQTLRAKLGNHVLEMTAGI